MGKGVRFHSHDCGTRLTSFFCPGSFPWSAPCCKMSLLIFLPFLNDLSLHTVCWRAQLNSFHFWTPFATRFVLLRTKQKQFTQIKCKTYIKLTVLIPFSKSEIARVECLTAMSAYKPLTNCRDSPKCQHSLTIYEFCYSPLESARSWGQSPLRDWDPARFLVHPVRARRSAAQQVEYSLT